MKCKGNERIGCIALGLTTDQDGLSLIQGDKIWLEKDGDKEKDQRGDFDIIASPRVGVDYEGGDAARSWRFRLIFYYQ